MSELRPCPFCGNEPVVEGNLVACNNLNCPTHDNYWTDPMIFTCDQWNNRPIEDALNARIAELEAAQRWIPVSEPPKECEWKAYVPGLGAPTVNKRYLVKLINDWITIATYYLRVGGGYWKDDRGQELADGVVSLWKGLEE